MPQIETTEELADTIADWLGIYGSCQSDGIKGCKLDNDKPFCCRIGFVGILQQRIINAVQNDKIIEQALISSKDNHK